MLPRSHLTYLCPISGLLLTVLFCWQCKSPVSVSRLPFEKYVSDINDSLKASKPDVALALVQCLLEDKLEARQKAEALFLKGITHKARSEHKQALTDFQAVKKILDKKSLVSEKTTQNYQQEFRNLFLALNSNPNYSPTKIAK